MGHYSFDKENSDDAKDNRYTIAFEVLLTSISKGKILDIFKKNVSHDVKTKIFTDFREVCMLMVEGYKVKNDEKVMSGIKKLLVLYEYIDRLEE